MEKISLYIAGKKVDLDNNSFILFNYTMEDLSNPTIVKNSFSKQITLQGTPANNEIFGNLYRSDRKTAYGDGYTGVTFDPLRKTPFTIYNEMNEIIESGYVKVDSIANNAGRIEYKVTLYGGLGSFFYGLTYNEDGSKKTLADLAYKVDGVTIYPSTTSMRITAEEVEYAWGVLQQESEKTSDNISLYGLVNFVPAYNGYPQNFDANKAYYKPYVKSRNMPNIYVEAEGYTTHPDGDGGIIIDMKNNHTEWEMQDLRSYLQRPAIRFACILRAISSISIEGYSLRIDDECWTPMLDKVWMTLPLLDWSKTIKESTTVTLSQLLKSTLSPTDYLLSFAKMMGYVFVTDAPSKVITMVSRNKFYGENTYTIDLSSKIDAQSIELSGIVDTRYLLFQTTNVGESAKTYADKYGKRYGSQVVNTGYQFNVSENDLLKDFAFKGACDVMKRNLNFCVYGGNADPEYGTYENYLFKFAFTEEVSWKLYMKSKEDLQEKSFTPLPWGIAPFAYNQSVRNADCFPKIQLHSEDNKQEDGSNILLFYAGDIDLPVYEVSNFSLAKITFFLTDDRQGMLNLNGGKPCWNLCHDSNAMPVYKLPSFRRVSNNLSIDFGKPQEEYAGVDLSEVEYIYANKWKKYIQDRYDVDARVMRCKVNLSGLAVGQGLLRAFYYYDNAIWVLNKISNYSITTDDLTECEFVKVKDIKNYTEGQKL